MTYQVLWDEAAVKDLMRIAKKDALRIKKKVDEYLVHDPVGLGKPLSSRLKGFYRYRIGSYRVIYEVREREVVIEVVKVGHRREVYEE